MLDDRDGVLDDAHGDAWWAWLRLSNALALRDWPTIVTTTSVLGPASVAPSDETPGHGRPVGACLRTGKCSLV
ncbi:hypothetical protein ACFYPG_05905 [Micromonospora sp. NPDC005553]|uniref:hypothetical protein n=1 Tax=Micromonospora sp. NPDC005553 TaxID=3364232 RepID=UPI0036C373DD